MTSDSDEVLEELSELIVEAAPALILMYFGPEYPWSGPTMDVKENAEAMLNIDAKSRINVCQLRGTSVVLQT